MTFDSPDACIQRRQLQPLDKLPNRAYRLVRSQQTLQVQLNPVIGVPQIAEKLVGTVVIEGFR